MMVINDEFAYQIPRHSISLRYHCLNKSKSQIIPIMLTYLEIFADPFA